MNTDLLRRHVKEYLAKRKGNPSKFDTDLNERKERAAYYQSWTPERLKAMNADEFTEYLSKLWAMRIWGNKEYVANELHELQRASQPVEASFRSDLVSRAT